MSQDKPYRTHNCGELRKEQEGQEVLIAGWVHSRRDLGGVIFIDLRDGNGITQVTFDPERNKEAWEVANVVRTEWVISVRGQVSLRPDNMVNKKMITGEIELNGAEVQIFSKAKTLPFEIKDDINISEELRLKYRYLDLRRNSMQQNLKFRAKVIKYIRDWMVAQDFLEIETPILTASSPEGARDFLVPSRLNKGKFYALPQAPQQYKQLLMIGGIDRYFQIAPCMRDEDARADRSPGEFYQLDTEVSFMTQPEFMALMEPLFFELAEKIANKKVVSKPFPQITYKESMNRFGTDKPDLRFGFEFIDVTELGAKSDFKVFSDAKMVKMICIKDGASKIGRNEIDKILVPLAQKYGAGGLAWMRMGADGLESSIVKFFNKELLEELIKLADVQEGDLLFFVADKKEIVYKALGEVRIYCGNKMDVIDQNELAFAWIIDFPMFEVDSETGKVGFSHNPFSMPQGGLDDLVNKDPLDVLAYQYDIICNGYELSSGAVRNYNPEIFYKAFELAGYTKELIQEKFGHMIDAFSYGSPPTCGFAPGIERLIMVLKGESSIREITAFPKNSQGHDVVVGAPAEIDGARLKELLLDVDKK